MGFAMKRLSETLKRYSYLIRIVTSALCVFLLTSLLLSLTVLDGSYREMSRQNDSLYGNVTESFARWFECEVATCRQHALTVAYMNETAREKIQPERFEKQPYYYYEACTILNKYLVSLPRISGLGLYYFGEDYILTNQYKYDLDAYLERCGGTANDGFAAFFQEGDGGIRFFNTFSEFPLSEARLYIGIPVVMNANRPALLFYTLSSTAVSGETFGIPNLSGGCLAVFGADGKLLFENSRLPISRSDGFSAWLAGDGGDVYRDTNASGNGYTAYRCRQKDLTFVSFIPQDAVETGVRQFYSNIQKSLLFVLLAFLTMLGVLAYISYRPVVRLARHARGKNAPSDAAEGELTVIRRAIDEMEDAAAANRDDLFESLFSNLLHGIPVTEDALARLSAAFPGSRYRVVTVVGLRLDSARRRWLLDAIGRETGARVCAVDMLRRNQMALIGAGVPAENGVLGSAVSRLVAEATGSLHPCGEGMPVETLSELAASYRSSQEALHAGAPAAAQTPEEREAFVAESVAFLEQYVKGVRPEDACRQVSSFLRRIAETCADDAERRYFVSEFLSGYFKLLRGLHYPRFEEVSRTCFDAIDADLLEATLHGSLADVCAFVSGEALSVYDTLRRDLIDYVNENFRDPALCRALVADRFSISVYTFSRVFKSQTGIGFKEYILARRLEYACGRLADSSDSIAEIAAQSGFSDPDYFARLFRASYGMTPSQYHASRDSAPSEN